MQTWIGRRARHWIDIGLRLRPARGSCFHPRLCAWSSEAFQMGKLKQTSRPATQTHYSKLWKQSTVCNKHWPLTNVVQGKENLDSENSWMYSVLRKSSRCINAPSLKHHSLRQGKSNRNNLEKGRDMFQLCRHSPWCHYRIQSKQDDSSCTQWRITP